MTFLEVVCFGFIGVGLVGLVVFFVKCAARDIDNDKR